MAIPLQKTKLFIPPARARLVERTRLLERLDGLCVEGSRAALISAPAGSGKTTLAVQWLSRLGWPVGWLSLDARDNTPARFFAYLVAALRSAVPPALKQSAPELGKEALALLELPGARMEEVVTLLTNDLVEAPAAQMGYILALDDFHVITNPLLHQAVDLLIEAQPPQMRLLLLSREDPVMQLARRRARGQLVELRQEDLRFRLEEAVAFLNQSMDLSLTSGQVQALEARTEGWIAGLQMAALALQGAADTEAFIRNFSGSQRFILDYLMEEVLAQQPADVQRFLLDTAILERMCADLCGAVSTREGPEAQALLEQLGRANLFVIPLDEERRWFRYHHLFRDLLLTRLQGEGSSRMAQLKRRASDWYEADGDPRLAVEYALKAGDIQRAADLLERHISERWQTVDLDFHMLVSRLPFEVIAERPGLCLQSAWLCVLLGQTDRILTFVQAAERALALDPSQRGPAAERTLAPDPSQTGSAAQLAFARALRAYLADLKNEPVDLDESLALACAAIPEENPGMRNSVAVVIGTICYMEGDFAAALRYFEDAIALDQRVNGTNAVPIATMRIALVLQSQGRLLEARRRLNQSEAYIRERGARRFYISGALNLRLADLMLEWNRLDDAEAQIGEGMKLLEDWPVPTIRGLGLSLQARLQLACGELAAAQSTLEQADALRRQTGLHPAFLDAIERVRVQLLLAEQRIADGSQALAGWASENEPLLERFRPGQTLRYRYESRLIELARVWLALGQKLQAIDLLERLANAARERAGSQILILGLLAAAYSQETGPDRASHLNNARSLQALEQALRLAEPEGYLRTFVDLGPLMGQAIERWLLQPGTENEPRLSEYARRILAAIKESEQPDESPAKPAAEKATADQPASLAEPLSPREQEILRYVAEGLTNQQVADRLVISVRTVKKHIENIHGKLGAQNRTQAVARARELGLLR